MGGGGYYRLKKLIKKKILNNITNCRQPLYKNKFWFGLVLSDTREQGSALKFSIFLVT